MIIYLCIVKRCKIRAYLLILQRNDDVFSSAVSRKVYYRYNPSTDSYERVYPTRSQRVLIVFKRVLEGVAIGGLILWGLYMWIDLPREKMLRAENEKLRDQISDLDRRLTTSIDVMENLAERDNNFYRVMMHADPITDAQRYAGIDMEQLMAPVNSLNDAEMVRTVAGKMDILEHQIYTQIKSFEALRDMAVNNKDRLAHIPSIQPVADTDLRQMASGYGYRVDPVYGTMKHHDGMDFASAIGTPVYATGDGVVKSADRNSGYGNTIDIDHGYNYMTRYAHLSKILVKPGQHVKRGDLIGRVGNTGKSTGSHLHYEVRYKGVPQNPVNYYFQDLTPEEYAELIQQSENAGHVMD